MDNNQKRVLYAAFFAFAVIQTTLFVQNKILTTFDIGLLTLIGFINFLIGTSMWFWVKNNKEKIDEWLRK